MPNAITPDDGPFFLALAVICVGILALVVYLALSGSDGVMTAPRR